MQERYSKKHIPVYYKRTQIKDPPVTVITDADLINEIHDIKINTVPTRFRSSPALHGGLISNSNLKEVSHLQTHLLEARLHLVRLYK